MRTRRIGTLALVGGAVALGASIAAAQVSPTAPPHPNMPWNYYNAEGQVIRYIQMPPQQVTVNVPVDVPAGVPPQTQPQVVEIPGYVVTETTTGYIYPERWTLQQSPTGALQWVRVPGEFRRK
jgi:hypothetical protein